MFPANQMRLSEYNKLIGFLCAGFLCAFDRIKQQRLDSPVPSCVSMKNDLSMEPPLTFKEENISTVER
jgi:hypothetical protein